MTPTVTLIPGASSGIWPPVHRRSEANMSLCTNRSVGCCIQTSMIIGRAGRYPYVRPRGRHVGQALHIGTDTCWGIFSMVDRLRLGAAIAAVTPALGAMAAAA